MRVISLTVAHYGRDYIRWGLRSVADSVDACYVLYSDQPTFGHVAGFPCPETKEELQSEAQIGAGDKLRWITGHWWGEGQHRDAIMKIEPDADVILIVDTDEVWEAGLAEDVIHHFERHPDHRTVRILTTHYWRSFYRGILNDTLHAEHGHAPKSPGTVGHGLESERRIHHFGYAQNSGVTYYKQFTHGHRPEWRSDWYETKFAPNAQFDCHPVIHDFWNPTAINPWDIGLPSFMTDHPFAALEVIP